MKKPKLSPKIKMRKDLDGYILYHTSGKTLLLNKVGYDILTLCDGNNYVEDIANYISKKYETNLKKIKTDTKEFLEKFQKIRLIDFID